jgi:hypothetical protein
LPQTEKIYFFCSGTSEETNKIKEQSIIALGEIYAKQQ